MSRSAPTTSESERKQVVPLALHPLDVLFFGDGRPSATSTRLASQLPLPQTVGGAILATLLRGLDWDFAALREALRERDGLRRALRQTARSEAEAQVEATTIKGPWFARIAKGNPKGYEILVPVPHDLYWLRHSGKKELIRVELTGTPYRLGREGLNVLAHARERITLRPGKLEPVSGFLTEQGLRDYLSGEIPPESEIVPEQEIITTDNRVGIALSPDTLTSERGALYGRNFLSLRPGVFVYVQVESPADVPVAEIMRRGCLFPLGGERRYVRAEILKDPWELASWPGNLSCLTDLSGPAVIMLTTPGIYPDAVPPGLDCEGIAMSCRRFRTVSGWNLAIRAPRPSRVAVDSGTVYAVPALRPMMPLPLVSREDDALYGWGCWVAGELSAEEEKCIFGVAADSPSMMFMHRMMSLPLVVDFDEEGKEQADEEQA